MKSFIITTLLLVFLFSTVHAQFLGGIFSQKKTQTEYLVKQVAALQVYIGYLEKGYDIAKKGLNTIGDITGGHFTLDQFFFDGLKQVHPAVRNYPRAGETMALVVLVKQLSGKTLRDTRNSEHLTAKERAYVGKVVPSINNYAAQYAAALSDLLSPGKLTMDDAERIRRVDELYREVSGLYRFICLFSDTWKRLAAGQRQEQSEAEVLKKIYQ